ncbi:MAG: hypothetical protein QG625_1781 [Cyanobacteriota bacterium erpe_2018_sw_39hr_WHONDRS-SW48-000098_B_bin.30]|nr:hypothetical protein [Cyanobacteriota bacterium erpe_2018_sw_39hr_WHONDRS-SW48-000098_B_bin.30]
MRTLKITAPLTTLKALSLRNKSTGYCLAGLLSLSFGLTNPALADVPVNTQAISVQEVSSEDVTSPINLRPAIEDTKTEAQAEAEAKANARTKAQTAPSWDQTDSATDNAASSSSGAPLAVAAPQAVSGDTPLSQTLEASAQKPDQNIADAPRAIAQGRPISRDNDFVPIDLTPVRLPERVSTFNNYENFKAQALYKLPGRVFFNASVENSLRFEANTFQTNRHYLSDMIYRVLPNVTAGYALTKKTRVAANYFFFRDQYDLRASRLSRNIHSVGGRIDHDIPINEKTMLSVGVFSRALFIQTANAPNIDFYDIIPSATITRRAGMNGVVYGSVLGQLRFRDPFSNFQEGDQFYSLGGIWRKGAWSFLGDSTLVTNFGNSNLRGGPNNQVIILTGEVGRRIHPHLPVTAFVRAEPIFNMGANTTPGFSGFNFRIFGGIRAEVSKPPIFPIKLKG